MKNTVELIGYYGSDEFYKLNKVSGIYKITCIPNNKIYIGSSKNILNRFNTHIRTLKNNTHRNPHLQSAWNLHSEFNFKFEVIECVDKDKLILKEQFYMDQLKAYDREYGFNNCSKADRPTGYKHTEENKKIMSLKKKGIKQSLETIEKRVAVLKGKRHTEETKLKISNKNSGKNNGMYGKVETEEHKKERMKNMLNKPRWNKGLNKNTDERCIKLGLHRKGKPGPNQTKCKMINNITGESYIANSLHEMSRISNVPLISIYRMTKGVKNMKGYEIIIL